ncbi:MAG: pilus assembly protein TadG-related protein [Pseudolysinimonas sp.]
MSFERFGALRAINRRIARMRDETGAVTVITAIMMTVLLGMAALVIDVGASEARRAQLQDAADAAAVGLAQRCFDSALTSLAACDGGVVGGASSTAAGYAIENVNDRSAAVTSVVFSANTVKVSLTSEQPSFFARIFNITSSTINTNATAKWTQPAVPLPLAYHQCALPAPSSSAVQFLRYDLLDLNLSSCGLVPGVLDLLGPGWVTQTDLISLDDGLSLMHSDCSFDIDLVAYVSTTLTKVLPTQCSYLLPSLIGRQVLLPVYDRILVPIVVNGVLLNQGMQITKYALVEVTGYDFQTLDVNLLNIVQATIGPKNMPATGPHCPNLPLLPLEVPACQGLQGVFHGYLTPAEAAQRLAGVQLID